MPETTTRHTRQAPTHHETEPWYQRFLHSWFAWSSTSALVLLTFMISGIYASRTGADGPIAVFYLVSITSLIFAVFITPAWAVTLLETQGAAEA